MVTIGRCRVLTLRPAMARGASESATGSGTAHLSAKPCRALRVIVNATLGRHRSAARSREGDRRSDLRKPYASQVAAVPDISAASRATTQNSLPNGSSITHQ